MAVVYVDECRVSRQAPVPYVWQVRGQPAVGLPAERGASGYSVLGFWQPGAVDPARAFVGLLSETAWTAELFFKAVDEQGATLDRPTVLVLDNASIHWATCVQQRLNAWRTAGLQLQFLPAYSPELNRIEILWRFLKHYWLTPPDYDSLDTLHQRLQTILKRIGTDYTVSFTWVLKCGSGGRKRSHTRTGVKGGNGRSQARFYRNFSRTNAGYSWPCDLLVPSILCSLQAKRETGHRFQCSASKPLGPRA